MLKKDLENKITELRADLRVKDNMIFNKNSSIKKLEGQRNSEMSDVNRARNEVKKMGAERYNVIKIIAGKASSNSKIEILEDLFRMDVDNIRNNLNHQRGPQFY